MSENLKRPKLQTLEKLEELNEKIKELYKTKREVLKKIMETYGEGEYLYELEEVNENGQKYVRYKFTDHLEAFESGEPMYKASSFERYSFETKYLKRQPKEK